MPPTRWLSAWAVISIALLSACSGGGSRSSFDAQATLVDVTFLDVAGRVPTDPEPPRDAPLLQQVVWTFDGRPDPSRVNARSLPIRDLNGTAVPGTWRVDGPTITFTPRLPTRDPEQPTAAGVDAGLKPSTTYVVAASPSTWSFIAEVAPALRARFPDAVDANGMRTSFETTDEPTRLLRGLTPRAPRVVETSPRDGSFEVGPFPLSDPDQLFPRSEPIVLTLDGPLHPGLDTLESFTLVDIDDPLEPSGLPVDLVATLVENTVDRSVVSFQPHGILAFGHLHAIEAPRTPRGLSQGEPSSGPSDVVGTFTTASAPNRLLDDALVERFEDDARRDRDEPLPLGVLPANWDRLDSGVLTASVVLEGFGGLGRFLPPPPDPEQENRVVVLDTARQGFPLLDGSTPDATPGTEVLGGVFPFTVIDIPKDVIIMVVGPNPLVLSATESVRIGGEIHLQGRDGSSDFTIDSAVFPMPGGRAGSGGGHGGEGHPTVQLGGGTGLATLVDPPRAGNGFSGLNADRSGGQGGQCGTLDFPDQDGLYSTDLEINCNEGGDAHNNGYKAPGGGGGSFRTIGTTPRNGIGNVLADGQGHYIVRPVEESGWNVLAAGRAARGPFVDPDPLNDFIGTRGELTKLQGGLGGGGGASVIDSYYCGVWCRYDDEPLNDVLCAGEFQDPPNFPDTAGAARGGGGGGGGGALSVLCLGEVTLDPSCRLWCDGGGGGGGEQQGCSNWGGCGAGGSGGSILIQSNTSIKVKQRARLEVAGGSGQYASDRMGWLNSSGECANERDPDHMGSGGDGGDGLIQLQLPPGRRADVDDDARLTDGAWVDPDNVRNPAEFSSVSMAVSRWIDFGRVVDRGPPGTRPRLDFAGVDPVTGFVRTDDTGRVLDPASADVVCDYLGQLDPDRPGDYLEGEEPRADFIPPNATVKLEFQGAQPIARGSKEIDPDSRTEWTSALDSLQGSGLVRYRVTFDTTADGSDLAPTTPRPTVQSIRIRARY